MKNIISILLITTSIGLVYTQENAPYLLIEDVNNPQVVVQQEIQLAAGQNLSLKCCTNTRNDHDVFWTWRNKQLKTSDGVLKLHHVSKANEGLYHCMSPKTKLIKSVNIIIKTRLKRDDIFQYPSGSNIKFEDTLKMTDEFLHKYPPDSWGPKVNPHEIDDMWDRYHEEQAEKRRHNRNIGLTIGGIAVGVIAIIVIVVLIICKCNRNRNPPVTAYARPTPSAVRTHTGAVETHPLNERLPDDTRYRPVETHITPYPPPASVVPPPTQGGFNNSVVKAPKLDCSPPPSYNEALNNAGPSAPPVIREHRKPTAPQL